MTTAQRLRGHEMDCKSGSYPDKKAVVPAASLDRRAIQLIHPESATNPPPKHASLLRLCIQASRKGSPRGPLIRHTNNLQDRC
ncbi:unnamed protein product [Chondrus crispus]|uniref:Uncharacterized protein n=1 Tax=Chondrus crispus TaxID=2769 RepID=R7QV08_CHOCR|nr:unnamed protein product [Chondrus crispus]CDF41195.1 unnamed protein product [Chondrus crispus]|eukprot:XP_005711489.1 unnamed protein product [Chondrus crispus]